MLLPDINHTQKLVIKNILQGQQLVSADPNCAITTILGSCVAACMYDPIARVGGMNHFLLPDAEGAQSNNLAYGINSMELLVNDMLKKGASRQNIHVKLI
jgi:chemotaxis protein CheD